LSTTESRILWLFATLHQELPCRHFENLKYISHEIPYFLITSVIIDKFPLCVFQSECLSLDSLLSLIYHSDDVTELLTLQDKLCSYLLPLKF